VIIYVIVYVTNNKDTIFFLNSNSNSNSNGNSNDANNKITVNDAKTSTTTVNIDSTANVNTNADSIKMIEAANIARINEAMKLRYYHHCQHHHHYLHHCHCHCHHYYYNYHHNLVRPYCRPIKPPKPTNNHGSNKKSTNSIKRTYRNDYGLLNEARSVNFTFWNRNSDSDNSPIVYEFIWSGQWDANTVNDKAKGIVFLAHNCNRPPIEW